LAPPERNALVRGSVAALQPNLSTFEEAWIGTPGGLSSLVGREQEQAEVRRLLRTARLVTLTGPGGVGKTRLALAVAAASLQSYPDGVRQASLGPVMDPTLVPQVVAAANGVPEQGRRSVQTTLTEALRDRRALLVLDNCEHLIQPCAELVEALLLYCPQLAVLATSREALGVMGEVNWRVPTLAVPPFPVPRPDELSQYHATQLFVERAAAIRPDFQVTSGNAPAVAEVCRRLDGIPLAIELGTCQPW
jgi:predicted ATPase